MVDFGHFSLSLSWLLSLYAMIVGCIGSKKLDIRFINSCKNALILGCIALALATISLGLSFQNDDYSIQYIWQYSNREMPAIYKWSAIWGGMDGSMLLWCFILSISCTVVALTIKNTPYKLAGWSMSSLASTLFFFTTVTLFFTNPFRYLMVDTIPDNGNGLNPLLQNPYMAIHPPMLYLGFTTFSVPYAFAMGALFSGEYADNWIRVCRRWILCAWAFLTIGIVLGGHWAYLELGWGGFWAWDPVENASFLPWLIGTALIHSVMVQERKGMLKKWNIWLAITTYALTVFGTFLTRSGIVQSVHSFASSEIGWIFLLYLSIVIIVPLILTVLNKDILKPERQIEYFFSREAAFLVNNLILLSICFAVLWGVMFPVLSESLTGKRQTVGIPYYNKITIPLFLFLLFTMGFGQLIPWRKATLSTLRRMFFLPTALALFIPAALLFGGITSFYALTSYSLCSFVFFSLLGEFHRGLTSQRKVDIEVSTSVVRLLKKHRSRYAGYLVHLGVVIVTIGITASMAHKTEKEFTLSIGESYVVDRFKFTLKNLKQNSFSNYDAVVADILLTSKNEAKLLHPEFRYYHRKGETTSEIALRMGLREDIYLVLAAFAEDGKKITVKLFINPLQVWLWFGVVIMILGSLIIFISTFTKQQNINDSILRTTQ
jgi:cytochrome c-type biogenesis protein CcmF